VNFESFSDPSPGLRPWTRLGDSHPDLLRCLLVFHILATALTYIRSSMSWLLIRVMLMNSH